ncbi:hypothetical protein [Paraburkholderia tropica]|uniref:hypothetical protein n=1 Tax=Paraburkholderia tropica TaxID=92647 RepID=UPI002AB7C2FF|nr:hypothetical protein [Paraburkholderia tropica]
MRYFSIRISRPSDGAVYVPNANGTPGFSVQPFTPSTWSYTSLNAGATVTTVGGTNRAAQLIQMDIPVTAAHTPMANAYVKIYGISLAEIAQAADLNGLNVAIYGGFAAGLPLATPAQAGMLCSGQILQAFGNWINTEQSLSIYVQAGGSSGSSAQTTGVPSTTSTTPAPTTNDTPANLTFSWTPGQTLLAAITKSLSTAFPQYGISGAISANLVKSGASANGFYSTLQQFAQDMNAKSLSAILGYAPGVNAVYQGVAISLQNNTFCVQDGSSPTTAKQLQVVDFVGQPTWGQPYRVQATVMMRADLNFGDFVIMPALPGVISAGSASQYYNVSPTNTYATAKSGSIFSGTFQIVGIRHVGDSRNGDGTAWATTLELLQTSASASTASATLPSLYAPTRGSQYSFYLPQ